MGGEDMPSRTSLTCGRVRFWVLVETCFDGPRFPFRERWRTTILWGSLAAELDDFVHDDIICVRDGENAIVDVVVVAVKMR